MRKDIWCASVVGLLCGASWAAGGCQLIGGFEAFTGVAGGTSCDAPAGDGGPPMVSQARAGAGCFWIDRTEVTVADYFTFLAAVTAAPQQSAPCDGNTSFELDLTCLAELTAPLAGDHPVVCVDFCDAEAYCTFVGKRLCKGEYTALDDPSRSEWYAACSNDGARGFPYAKNYEEGLCNGGACVSDCASEAVGARESCEAECGALDMSGNVAEWVEQCNGPTCLVRGGGANDGQPALACESAAPVARLTTGPFLGLRCCADPR